jgi:hypothetical protein
MQRHRLRFQAPLTPLLKQIKYKESRDKLLHLSEKFSLLATELLGSCFESDSARTGRLLRADTIRFKDKSLLKVRFLDSSCKMITFFLLKDCRSDCEL